MRVPDLLTVDRIACDVDAESKQRALELMSGLIARARGDLGPAAVFDSLLDREQLGSTGLGHGVAIPHGRTASGDRTVVAFARLRRGVDYEAVDRQPVDLLFGMLVPERAADQHLHLLAQLAEMFSDEAFRQSLRRAPDPAAVHQLFQDWQTRH